MSPFLREQVVHRGPAQLVVARTDQAAWFVQGKIDFALYPNRLAVDGNLVCRGIHLGAQLANRLPIDRDTSGEDNLLSSPARGHTGIGQKLLKSLSQIGAGWGCGWIFL